MFYVRRLVKLIIFIYILIWFGLYAYNLSPINDMFCYWTHTRKTIHMILR